MSEAQPKFLLLEPGPSGGRQSSHAIESPAPAAGAAARQAASATPASARVSTYGCGRDAVMAGSFARERGARTPQTRRRPSGSDGRRAEPDWCGLSVERLHLAPGDVLRRHRQAVRADSLPRRDVAAGGAGVAERDVGRITTRRG